MVIVEFLFVQQTYFVSLEDMFTALDTFTAEPSLEYRLWRICAIRIAVPILMAIDEYQVIVVIKEYLTLYVILIC